VAIEGSLLSEKSFTGILAGTVEYIGMWFSPLYRANEKSGTFHCFISSMRPLSLIKIFLNLLKV